MAPELTKMRSAGRLASQTLDYLEQFVEPGVSTEFLDEQAISFIERHGAISACLGYTSNNQMPPFPKHICTSVNHVACHGIPNSKTLKKGDSLNIDVTVILDGHYGDTSRMYFAGKPQVKHQKLSDLTYELTMRTIDMLKPGIKISDIGEFGQEFVKNTRAKVLPYFCGHGIGTVFHKSPSVVNFVDPNLVDWNYTLQEGEFITVEPILTTGKSKIKFLDDKWTVIVTDREPCAQWEHTIAITADGFEIMTLS